MADGIDRDWLYATTSEISHSTDTKDAIEKELETDREQVSPGTFLRAKHGIHAVWQRSVQG